MRLIFATVSFVIAIAFAFGSCKSSSGPASFCDTACMKDTIKFTDDSHPLKPYVYISSRNCNADSVIWSYDGMGVNRKLDLTDLLGSSMRLDKKYMRCTFKDTSYVWLLFNNCSNGRGYFLKIPFSKKANISPKASAINSIDPKFSVAEGLAAYTDRGNIFIEEMATGKKAMMTFGEDIGPDYDAIHETIDSVNITPTRAWARIKTKDGWKEREKKIELQ
jgi:hypothetical protein